MTSKLDHKSISSWVRQARYRAKKHHIYSDLEIADVNIIIEKTDSKCVYCDKPAETLDCPFPLKEGGPNVPANLTMICRVCKRLKNNNDIVWMFSSGRLTQERYMEILSELFTRRGHELIKDHVRKATGFIKAEEDVK